ncbi:hypothetical protein NC653_036087 [Populus alba x Populus x berolinensis]|uniref:Uncharacterized protein n=1 Tax=Populus alba x Populus x berolinensis TaxID=444605 RepID=A0AAD6LKI9_9ROSI|nr:hypothetical protein NC653_036087 [Populus alba x Populus x berolinensis]
MQTDRDQMNKTNRIPNSSPSSEQNRTRPIIITIEHAGLRYLIVNGLGVSRFSSIVQQYEWLNGSQYKSIELVKSDWVATRKSPPSAIDYWGFDESIVRNIWEDKARIALNQQLTRARKNAMAKENTTNIIDCLDKGPTWINNDDWNQMIKDVWSTPEFQRRSESARRNRLSQTDGKISTHSGGTVSFASYRANMQEEAGGKEPPWDDVFSALHQSTKQSGSFVDNKSKKVVENYKMEMISKYGTDRENHPSFDGAAWCAASGGVTKGRVYGAPRMPKSIVSPSSSSHSYSVESSYPSSSYRALQEEIKKKDDLIFAMKRQMDSMQEYLVNNLGYHGGTSNIDQGMPSPLTPSIPPHMAPQIMTSMGPTSQPIYRPTPRPLYPDQQYHGSSSQPEP